MPTEKGKLNIVEDASEHIIQNLSSYIYFIQLYRKPRPIAFKKRVERILKEESSIVRRIEKIQVLDEQLEEGIELELAGLDESKKISSRVNKKKKRYSLGSKGIFSYFFVERAKIRDFANRTRTLRLNFFGMGGELSYEGNFFWQSFSKRLREILLDRVQYTLLYGWKHLDPLPYNSVVLLYRLLIKVIRLENSLRQTNMEHNLKLIHSFIQEYLQLDLDSYKYHLKESLVKVLSQSIEYKNELVTVIRLLEEFVDTESKHMAFFNVILGIYSVYYKRFITKKDLLAHYTLSPLDDVRYDLNQRAMTKILDYKEKLNQEMEILESQIFHSQFVHRELNWNSSSNDKWVESFNRFVLFEKRKRRDELTEKNPFQFFTVDLLGFLVQSGQGFYAFFCDILQSIIIVSKEDKDQKVRIFAKEFLGSELGEMQEIFQDHGYITSSGEMLSISWESYLYFLSRHKMELEKEERICLLVQRFLRVYESINKKIVGALFSHHRILSESGEDLFNEYKNQNEPIRGFSSQYYRLIPYANYFVEKNSFFESEVQVVEVLNEIAFYTLNLLYLFHVGLPLQLETQQEKWVLEMENHLVLQNKLLSMVQENQGDL